MRQPTGISKSNTGLALIVSKKTAFIKFDTIYPECQFYIEDEPKLHPLICLVGPCHRGNRCMEKLVKRTKFVFDVFPEVELLILYFKYRDNPNSIRCGEFWKDYREPKYSTMNPGAWDKFKELGEIFEFDIPDRFFLDQDINVVTVNKSLPVIK